jgi:vacuolar-type H+-ATPase subunit I/STV1
MLQGLHEKYEQVPVEEQAGVQWLIDRLEIYRQQRQQELEEYFATLDEDALKQQVENCIRKGALRNGQS